MTAYLVKEIDETSGYVGFFVASNTRELFWAVDEFINPRLMEFAVIGRRSGGVLFKSITADSADCICDGLSYGDECYCREHEELELSENLDYLQDRKWRKFSNSDSCP